MSIAIHRALDRRSSPAPAAARVKVAVAARHRACRRGRGVRRSCSPAFRPGSSARLRWRDWDRPRLRSIFTRRQPSYGCSRWARRSANMASVSSATAPRCSIRSDAAHGCSWRWRRPRRPAPPAGNSATRTGCPTIWTTSKTSTTRACASACRRWFCSPALPLLAGATAWLAPLALRADRAIVGRGDRDAAPA